MPLTTTSLAGPVSVRAAPAAVHVRVLRAFWIAGDPVEPGAVLAVTAALAADLRFSGKVKLHRPDEAATPAGSAGDAAPPRRHPTKKD